jgi:hypothetical protein
VLDEFRRLVCQASAAHQSLPAFGEDLIRVVANHSERIDHGHETEQTTQQTSIVADFCRQWCFSADELSKIIELYRPEHFTELGSDMRSIMVDLATSCVIALPTGAEAAARLEARRRASSH